MTLRNYVGTYLTCPPDLPERRQTDFTTGYDRLTAGSLKSSSENTFHSPNFSNQNIQKINF